ncbi:MAG: Na(+)/H(+) antiporter subunit D [Alphaproteobacteria bacterium]|nr:Na(+)/H(+) antiporter subunit D [Alphaproteobacteria bacterium]
MTNELNPGLIVILGALLVPFLPGRVLRGAFMLMIPIAAFAYLRTLPMGDFGQMELMGLQLQTLRIDKLSTVFGTIFLIATLLGVIYALHLGDWVQHTAGLIYAGSAIGAVFAGDFVTLFFFWELTAISSVFLIWASGTANALSAGLRYLVIQVGSGVILLAGVLMHYRATGTLTFGAMSTETLPGTLILIAFGIKCAFPLLHNWLANAYPAATVTGTVILSVFTTKLAVYTLARGYAGTEILIPIGVTMALFTVIYALLENDLRRVLAYSLIGQLGLMVAGIGIGSDLAINGAVAHAACGILYFALLFMAIGAVLHRTGTAHASKLGGLAKSMPLTATFAVIGALAAAAVPFFAGFISKALILSAAMKAGHFWAWAGLLAAGAAVVIHTAIKVPYFAFFAKAQGEPGTEAPANMLLAMGLTAALCIGLGVYPEALYSMLPREVKYQPYTTEHIITQLQLVCFAALAFVLALRFGLFPATTRATLLDSDWFYRVPGRHLAMIANRFRSFTWEVVADGIVKGASKTYHALYHHHGPDGLFGRTWPTGMMAFWTTVTLGAVVILSYL